MYYILVLTGGQRLCCLSAFWSALGMHAGLTVKQLQPGKEGVSETSRMNESISGWRCYVSGSNHECCNYKISSEVSDNLLRDYCLRFLGSSCLVHTCFFPVHLCDRTGWYLHRTGCEAAWGPRLPQCAGEHRDLWKWRWEGGSWVDRQGQSLRQSSVHNVSLAWVCQAFCLEFSPLSIYYQKYWSRETICHMDD